jgi:hypothetical protein
MYNGVLLDEAGLPAQVIEAARNGLIILLPIHDHKYIDLLLTSYVCFYGHSVAICCTKRSCTSIYMDLPVARSGPLA